MKAIYPTRKITDNDVVEMWRHTWNQHEEEVNRYFSGKTNLLRVNIEDSESKKSLIQSLKDFGYNLTSEDLPYVGATPAKRKISDSNSEGTD